MSKSNRYFKQFEDHTLLKHAFLRAYLVKWASILMNKRRPLTRSVCFIDALAGRGSDATGVDGSPLIALKAAIAIEDLAATGQIATGAKLRVALVEKDPKSFATLRSAVREMDPDGRIETRCLEGDYATQLRELGTFAGTDPTLTFVDPFGVKGLNAEAMRFFLRGPRNELFVLASGVGAARLRGVIDADGSRFDTAIEQLTLQQSLFPELAAAQRATLEKDKEDYISALDPTQKGSREALLAALGDAEAVDELGRAPKGERSNKFVQLLGQVLSHAGASHLLVIPMSAADGQYKYTLMHASKSPTAMTAMKEGVSSALNRDELSPDMRGRIRKDLLVDLSSLLDRLAIEFAGQELRWSSDEDGVRSLKTYLLESTPLFGLQCDELKKRLRDAKWLSRKLRKEWVQFPTR